jgi:predicted transcriptional regulator
MSDFQKHLQHQLNDPEFKQEWEDQEAEFQCARALIAARTERNMTQKDLAEKTGVRQSNISRIENCSCSPTISTLSTLAKGMGKTLRIEIK